MVGTVSTRKGQEVYEVIAADAATMTVTELRALTKTVTKFISGPDCKYIGPLSRTDNFKIEPAGGERTPFGTADDVKFETDVADRTNSATATCLDQTEYVASLYYGGGYDVASDTWDADESPESEDKVFFTVWRNSRGNIQGDILRRVKVYPNGAVIQNVDEKVAYPIFFDILTPLDGGKSVIPYNSAWGEDVTPGFNAAATVTISGGAVSGMVVTIGGTGYNPNNAYVSISGDGTGAKFKLNIVGGVVMSATLIDGGSGYTTATAVFNRTGGSGGGNPPEEPPVEVDAVATVIPGFPQSVIQSIRMDVAGNGYVVGPNGAWGELFFYDGAGTGARFRAISDGNGGLTFQVTSGGFGYLNSDNYEFKIYRTGSDELLVGYPPQVQTASATVNPTTTAVESVTPTNYGALGYSVADGAYAEISDGAGTGAILQITTDMERITGISVPNGGMGYGPSPTVIFRTFGGNGTGGPPNDVPEVIDASITVQADGMDGHLFDPSIMEQGNSYDEWAWAEVTTYGSGTGGKLQIIVDPETGQVVNVFVTVAGLDYGEGSGAPIVTVHRTGGDGSGNQAEPGSVVGPTFNYMLGWDNPEAPNESSIVTEEFPTLHSEDSSQGLVVGEKWILPGSYDNDEQYAPFVIIESVDENGKYLVGTWGEKAELTQRGLGVMAPSLSDQVGINLVTTLTRAELQP